MDFTTEEKRMIVRALEDTYSHLEDAIQGAVMLAEKGFRYEGEVQEKLLKMVEGYQAFLIIESKIFDTIEEEKLREGMALEVQQSIDTLKSWKETLGITEDAREPETVDS